MANCKAELNLNHFWINIHSEEDVYNSLYSLLEIDNDLTENEDYFRDDTLELGFKNEADRIVKEALEGKRLSSIEDYKAVAKIVAEKITEQEYYGDCQLSFVATTNDCLIVAFATGGSYGN
jgi:hypothetical protein